MATLITTFSGFLYIYGGLTGELGPLTELVFTTDKIYAEKSLFNGFTKAIDLPEDRRKYLEDIVDVFEWQKILSPEKLATFVLSSRICMDLHAIDLVRLAIRQFGHRFSYDLAKSLNLDPQFLIKYATTRLSKNPRTPIVRDALRVYGDPLKINHDYIAYQIQHVLLDIFCATSLGANIDIMPYEEPIYKFYFKHGVEELSRKRTIFHSIYSFRVPELHLKELSELSEIKSNKIVKDFQRLLNEIESKLGENPELKKIPKRITKLIEEGEHELIRYYKPDAMRTVKNLSSSLLPFPFSTGATAVDEIRENVETNKFRWIFRLHELQERFRDKEQEIIKQTYNDDKENE